MMFDIIEKNTELKMIQLYFKKVMPIDNKEALYL